MDRLFESARTGNVDELNQLLLETPLILDTVALSFLDNPLHLSCLLGHLEFVKKLLILKPEFAKELSSEGHTPLHMASANGHLEIVKELMKLDDDDQLCRKRDVNGRTPFHVAVLKGRVDVVKEMVSRFDGWFEDLSSQGETAVHVAVRYGRFECLLVMVECLRMMKKDGVLNIRDVEGNTLLHLAIWKKQRQVLELLLAERSEDSEPLDINAVNNGGLTPLDILLMFPSEAGDRELHELLQNAGASRSQNLNTTTAPTSQLVHYFKFKRGRDSPSSVRDSLLVIAVLVATAAYQVGMNPPGGVWQDDTTSAVKEHIAGRSVLGTYSSVTYTVLAAVNSMAFTLSLSVIGRLTTKFPLRTEFRISLVALFVTYNTAVAYMAPDSARVVIIVIINIFPVIVPAVAFLCRKYIL